MTNEEETIDCPECEGTGRIEFASFETDNGLALDTDWEYCRECEGTGCEEV